MNIQLKDIAKNIDNLTLEEESQLISLAKSNQDYKTFVFEHFSGLIVAMAKRYIRGDTVSLKDLMQQGYLGIDRAIKEYKPEMAKRFSTYARWWITAYIVEYYRDNSRPFGISGSISTKLNALMRASEKIEQEMGREPTNLELALATDQAEAHVTYLQRYLHSGVAIHEPLSPEDEGSSLEKMLPDNHCDSPLERATRNDSINRIKILMNSLNETQKFILTKRYGLDGGEVMTLNDVGVALKSIQKGKKTAERVRQIQLEAESQLRKLLTK